MVSAAVRLVHAIVPLAVVVMAWSCSPSAPSPVPAPPAPLPVPLPSAPLPSGPTPLRVSGLVTDEDGAPLGDAHVEIHFARGDRPPGLLIWFPEWVTARTDARGAYEIEFVAEPSSHDRAPELPTFAGVIRAWHGSLEDYEAAGQLVPWGLTDIALDLRLRRSRTVAAGESITVSFAPDSALCFDFDTLFSLTTRCEWIRVVVGPDEQVTADAQPTEPGGLVPLVWSQGYRAGLDRIGVSVPAGTSPQSYTVSTSIRRSP